MLQSSLRNKLSAFVQRRLQIERRGGKRVAPARHTLCLIRHPGEGAANTAIVHNMSFKGAALFTESEYPAGELLKILLINASHTFSIEVELRIVRSFRATTKQFCVAGPFERPLRHEEVVPFIV